MNKAVSWTLRFLLGIGLLGFLFWRVGISEILGTLRQMNLWYLPIVVLLYFANLLFGAINIVLLMHPREKKIPLWELFGFYMLSWAVGLFVPGRFGEVSLVYFLKKRDIPFGEGFLIFVLDKFISILFLGGVSAVAFFKFFDVETAVSLLIFVIVCIVAFGLPMFSSFLRERIKTHILRAYAHKFKGFSALLGFYVSKKFHLIILNFLTTGLRWLVSSVIYYFAFLSFGVSQPLWLVFLITCLTSVLSFVPITVSGLGIRESAGVYLYSLQGIDAPVVASSYLLVVVCSYTIASLVFYLSKYDSIFKTLPQEPSKDSTSAP